MKIRRFVFAVLLSTCASWVVAQDSATEKSSEPSIEAAVPLAITVQPTLHAADESIVVSSALQFLQSHSANPQTEALGNVQVWLEPFPYSSSDGHYASKNEADVKAYEQLAMEYEFIEPVTLRRQLRLADGEGLFVIRVDEEGEGHRNGFREGDLILRVDDAAVDTQYDFVIALTEQRDESRAVAIRRDGESHELHVTLTAIDDSDKRYLIGVSIDSISDLIKHQLQLESGVVVTHVAEDSAADAAGLEPHDIIVSLDGDSISSLDDLKAIVQHSNGQSIKAKVIRQGKRLSVSITPQLADEVTQQHLQLQIQSQAIPALQPYANIPHLQHLFGQYHHAAQQQPPEHSHSHSEAAGASSGVLSRLEAIEKKLDQLTELLK